MTKKKLFYGIVLLLALILAGAALYINPLMPIITGYAAKNLCSNVFVSGRDAREIEEIDLNLSFIKFTKNKVDFIGIEGFRFFSRNFPISITPTAYLTTFTTFAK